MKKCFQGKNQMKRCEWARATLFEQQYHDEEWGVPMNSHKIGCLLLAIGMLSGCSAGKQSGTVERNHPSSLKVRPVNQIKVNETEDHSICWFNADRQEKKTGVALVIHGLNLRPDKMGSIISCLNTSGIDALNLSLRGHGKNYADETHLSSSKARMNAFKTVSYQLWVAEASRAYDHAKRRSNEQNVPLFFIGFSLGAVLGGNLLTTYPDVQFDRMVLFAPAFNCTICNALKILAPFPGLIIPSLSSNSYRANIGIPMAGYIALFETIKHFDQNINHKLNIPTIIFIDKQDEFISYRKLKRLIETEKLYHWKFQFLGKGKVGTWENPHHLVIDEQSIGKDGWDKVADIMNQHLLSSHLSTE
jgi:esterase/lipase